MGAKTGEQKRDMGMKRSQIVVLTPPGLSDPSLAIAASRAGGFGVVDLEYVHDIQTAQAAIDKLTRYTGKDFGIKLDAHFLEFMGRLTSDLPDNLKVVLLTCTVPDRLEDVVKILHGKGLSVLLETTCLKEARFGEKIGVDGVVAKGQEAGGRVGNETTFILLQRFLRYLSLPVWAQGGIGLHTAAACFAAGAAGVILDTQLALTRESTLPEEIKTKIAAMDGTETTCIGNEIGECYRVCSKLGLTVIDELKRRERELIMEDITPVERASIWRQTVSQHLGWDSLQNHLFFLGQDAAFAASLAQHFVTVGGVLEGICQEVSSHCVASWSQRLLSEGSPLALSHRTRYPIVQGPMARVSDIPAFAYQVAQDGALPFMALGQMRAQEIDGLLQETGNLLKDEVWGVGLLGFLPPDLYREQVDVVLDHRPPFAIIAGGRSIQAHELEQEGIAAYLHVPSPGLLRMFLSEGDRRFIFEGREAGGHVGPLCGFVLWETAINVILDYLKANPSEEFHVLFAGGIHDDLSASMVAIMAAPLAEQGVRVGVQLGSAYLFTEEAVESGAIVRTYRQEAIDCRETTLLETGPGHAVRCIKTSYVEAFNREKQRLVEEKKSNNEIRNVLEHMNLGRLQTASKGVSRNPNYDQDAGVSKYVVLKEGEQRTQGLYMIGQLAGIQDQDFTIDMLHRDISVNGTKRIEELRSRYSGLESHEKTGRRPSDVAIIGMACVFPKASDLQTYWENILNRVNTIREIPGDRWDWRLYYDPDRKTTKDRTYSKWGAFLDDVPFDPLRYGMPPNSVPSIEPLQLITLESVNKALDDAAYSRRPFPRDRTSVILGISGSGELGQMYSFRSTLPMFFGGSSQEILSRFESALPKWTEDSFPGILMNVTAGRVANRFDLGGVNYTVDAACASSLAALYLGVKELESRSSDMVILGAADCMQNPFTYLCFSKTQALSPRGACNTLDSSADGIVLGEGVAALILKRLADAERDGDRIYAVIKGIGASSDGRDKSLTAPRKEGQVKALERAYAKAGFSPDTVGLIEAHGTGTVVGDRVEIETLGQVFKDARSQGRTCAIGSVKSMIGHTKSTAGLAGIIKVAMALHHKVLPPTLGIKSPNPALALPDSPFYPNTETRPWINHTSGHPRRAGINALGFGGTNFHAVMEEYTGDFLGHLDRTSFRDWPSELLIWRGSSRQDIIKAVRPLEKVLSSGVIPALRDLAFSLAESDRRRTSTTDDSMLCLAIVASSPDDLKQKLERAIQDLSGSVPVIHDPRGIYFSGKPLASEGKMAFLFPGQGSQYLDMLADMAVLFPEIQALFERSNDILEDRLPRPLSTFIFPPPAFTEEDRRSCEKALARTQVVQPAMGTVDLAVFHVLMSLGIKPDMVAGHSYGEYVALCVAGAFSEDDLIALSEARGRFIVEAAGQEPGTMAAVRAGIQAVSEVLKGKSGVWIANLNAPEQTIISGNESAVQGAIQQFKDSGVQARLIPVACAFHSPIVSKACDRLKDFLSGMEIRVPRIKVYSNTTAGPYPAESGLIAEQLVRHLVSKVEFIEEIKSMYRDGARIFVEVGPGRVLTGLVDQILVDCPHLTVTSNQSGRPGLLQLHHLLAQLAANGIFFALNRLFEGRKAERIDLKTLEKGPHDADLSPTTWLVNGARARPVRDIFPSGVDEIMTPAHTTIAEKRADPVQSETQKEQTLTSTPKTSHAQTSPVSDHGATQVMLQFQQLMGRFVDIQKEVMMTYLQDTGRKVRPIKGELPETSQTEGVLQTPFEQNSHVSRTEEPHDVLPQETIDEQRSLTAPEAVETPETDVKVFPPEKDILLDREELTSRLLKIVSERTGYPQEMLDMDLDLEADLGIDSIKRVEITSNFLQLVFPPDKGGPPDTEEDLGTVKTLRAIIDWTERHKKKLFHALP
jgi:acyl transferase domain-containing protein/NAD(P)H-dependent flavin oxidoreductase YrpB (nitropropane dioxygenase family)